MRDWMKWFLVAAVVALIVACISPHPAAADDRSQWMMLYGPPAYYGTYMMPHVPPYARSFTYGRAIGVYPRPFSTPQARSAPYSVNRRGPHIQVYLSPF
jgi:hypothetical protein